MDDSGEEDADFEGGGHFDSEGNWYLIRMRDVDGREDRNQFVYLLFN